MKPTAFFTRCLVIVAAATMTVVAQSPVNPVGVWVGLLQGQPATTLTLSDDSGAHDGGAADHRESRTGRRRHRQADLRFRQSASEQLAP